MCLIAFKWSPAESNSLILLANRDEMHARESAPAGPWPQAPHVFGGRDLKAGGSWMGITHDGRVAALTNVRDPKRMQGRLSRGKLVQDYLQPSEAPGLQDFAEQVLSQAQDYAGFNLLIGNTQELIYLSNHPAAGPQRLEPGVYGLSNASLNTPWPKLRTLTQALQQQLEQDEHDDEALLQTLNQRSSYPDHELPETGVGLPMERMLSPAFILSPTYGTRASSLLRLGQQQAQFIERRFDPAGDITGETRQTLSLYGPKN